MRCWNLYPFIVHHDISFDSWYSDEMIKSGFSCIISCMSSDINVLLIITLI